MKFFGQIKQVLFSVRQGYLPKAGFENTALNSGKRGAYTFPKTAGQGGFHLLVDFQTNFC